MDSHVGFEQMPLDVTLNICSNLDRTDRFNLLRVSRQANEIVRDAACSGDRSSLNALIIGLPQAGSTTVFWRLANQTKIELNNRLNQSSSSLNTTDIDTTKQGIHFLRQISLGSEGRKAVIFHGSSKVTTRRRMYPFYGLTQCLIIVIPAQIGSDPAAFKNSLRQLLLPAFALCGHLNWVFSVNKMDIVGYNEAVFNDVVAIASAVCNKISTKILNKATFIPISAAHSYNLQDTKYGNDTAAMSWYKGPSVLEKMNEISYTVHLPLHSFVSNARVAVIRVKALENAKNLAFNFAPKSGTYRVWGYVTNGLIATGDKVFIDPWSLRLYKNKVFSHFDRLPFTVKSIQVFHKEQKEAFAGTFIGLDVVFNCRDNFFKSYVPAWHLGHFLHHLILPIYHSITTEMSLDVADLGVLRNKEAMKGLANLQTTRKFDRPVLTIEADIVVVGSKRGTWDGKIIGNLSTGFYSHLTQTYCTVKGIKSSTDHEGQNYVENPRFVVKGQRAKVTLSFPADFMPRKYQNNASGEGRILLLMHERVVAIGVISALEKKKPHWDY